MEKKTMHFQDLSKEAQRILCADYKKRAWLVMLILCCAAAAGLLFLDGYKIPALFLLGIPVWLTGRYQNRQKRYFAALLDRHCRAAAMTEVHAYRYERGLTKRTRKERAALAARACIYSGDREKFPVYCSRADRLQAMYEQLFAAFVADDGESFDKVWENYITIAPQLKEKAKVCEWYHRSFEKLDIYRDYMDGEYEKFLDAAADESPVFTWAESVCLVYKKACLLQQREPAAAEQAFYYVLDRGGSMECIAMAKERLQGMFFNGQDQSTCPQLTKENQDSLLS